MVYFDPVHSTRACFWDTAGSLMYTALDFVRPICNASPCDASRF